MPAVIVWEEDDGTVRTPFACDDYDKAVERAGEFAHAVLMWLRWRSRTPEDADDWELRDGSDHGEWAVENSGGEQHDIYITHAAPIR